MIRATCAEDVRRGMRQAHRLPRLPVIVVVREASRHPLQAGFSRS
jgi:hypothetical protein